VLIDGEEERCDEDAERKGVFHAERVYSGLLGIDLSDDEERLVLIKGKCSLEGEPLPATTGNDLVAAEESGRDVDILSGLIITPASIGSGTKTGDTCTFSSVNGRETRG
jgi:hypothetical protein